MRGSAAVWLMVASLSCSAPVPKRVDFSETRRNYRAQDYDDVLRVWTRHEKVVSDVGIVIEAWATYKSWDFRQAYIEHYAKVYGLSDEDRAALYNSQLAALRKDYEFHVVVQTTSHQWNNLEKENTAWRVTLIDGTGAQMDPTAIVVQKLPEPVESRFFPYRTAFSRTYLVRFSRENAEAAELAGPKSGRVTLRIASPLGKAELVWEAI